MKGLVIFFSLFLMSLGNLCWAHGTHYEAIAGGSGVRVFYDDGKPMSYSEVKIYSPEDRKTEFQKGYTDKNGRFIFSPDVKGKWTVVVSDGMGHGIVTDVFIEEDMKIKKKDPATLSRWQKIVMGLSLILGITGLLFYFLTKRHYIKPKSSSA